MAAEGDKTQQQGKTMSVYNQSSGIFTNPWSTWSNEIFTTKFLFYQFLHRPEPSCKPNVNCPKLNRDLPICKPQFQQNLDIQAIRLTWLGHASVLFYVDGLHVLCDPIFSDRCSISRHAGGFIRYRPKPCNISDLPKIDAILISHNHHDHLDMPTLESLARSHPDALWCVPKGDLDLVSKHLQRQMPNGRQPTVIQFDWWQSHKLELSGSSYEFIFTPAQHWSGRNLLRGRCKSLWGSWAILGPRHRAWFAGDTGYCSVFKEIGEHLGPFDAAAIPIGSYHPRWYLKYQHVDPSEAVQVHQDVKAKFSVGVHWGTFAFTWESYLRPKEDLLAALENEKIKPSEFRTIHHGQSLYLERLGNGNNYYIMEL